MENLMEVVNDEHYRTIRKAIENNRLAVFVGSAVSFNSKLPSWGELIGVMKNALEKPRTLNDYLKIAEHYYLQYGKNTYYQKINEFFPNDSKPNQLHKLILDLKPQHIITTNWDDLLEKSISSHGELYFPVAEDHELAASPSSKLLVKMHGDLKHRNIVFKESDYLSYSDDFPLIENFLKSLFSTHVVLFIGYSISDHNLNQILSWIRNRTNDAPPAFTILTENEITLTESNYLREKGVYPLLQQVKNIETDTYSGLSAKSIVVAKTIRNILIPASSELLEILVEISKDISSWVITYPTAVVSLIKDRFNITEVNKIYFESEKNVIVYNLSDAERNFSRSKYRKIRKWLIEISKHIPIDSIQLHTSFNKYYRIKNKLDDNFINEYTTFDFAYISNRISKGSVKLNNDLDLSYQFAFDNYFLKRLEIARESYIHLANIYFSTSNFTKSLISSYNKKQLCFGELPFESIDSMLEVSMAEQLSKNDNISEVIDKFPKSILSRQKSLFHDLDANSSFFLIRFKAIANLSRAIDEEIYNIEKGAKVYSGKLESMYNQTYCLTLFVIRNKITVLYSPDFKNIAKIAFESIVKRRKTNSQNVIEIDTFLFYLALISFEKKELDKFLLESLGEQGQMIFEKETLNYALKVLDNSLQAISSTHTRSISEYSIGIWTKVLSILSYVNITKLDSSAMTNRLIGAFDTNQWSELSGAINLFLAFQANKYGKSLPVDDLKLLLNKQLLKVSSSKQNFHTSRSQTLFLNLLHLIKNNSLESDNIFDEEKEIANFINSVSSMEFTEKLYAINSFVFTIFSLSKGKFKNTISNLLADTFEEAKVEEFNEELISFGLNLFILGVLSDENLYFILERLDVKSKEHIEKKSTSTAYIQIKDQLSKIDGSKLTDYVELIQRVTELDSSCNRFFKKHS